MVRNPLASFPSGEKGSAVAEVLILHMWVATSPLKVPRATALLVMAGMWQDSQVESP